MKNVPGRGRTVFDLDGSANTPYVFRARTEPDGCGRLPQSAAHVRSRTAFLNARIYAEPGSRTQREVTAVQIPSGDVLTLPEGGACTSPRFWAAPIPWLRTTAWPAFPGKTRTRWAPNPWKIPPETVGLDENATLEERVWDTLKCIYDPEIPVDIVDLGLIYDVTVTELENGLHHVAVKMTLTAPGCGMGPHLVMEAKDRIEALEGVEAADVDMVWDPPWNQEMVSEEGKMKLGLI